MTTADQEGATSPLPNRAMIISSLGITQIFAWGSSYYLPAVLAGPISASTGWSKSWIIGGVSVGLLTAGLISPRIGRAIARHGGRRVLAASALLLAAGLALAGFSTSLTVFLASWVIIGFGMGAGLYDPAFAALVRIYGQQDGRSAITMLTLFGGFASTVCWPLSAWLEGRFGWRDTCLFYAGVQLALALPIYLFVLPRETQKSVPGSGGGSERGAQDGDVRPQSWSVFGLLAVTITLASIISTLMSVHLLTVLQGRGFDLAAAVALGALVGPSQVGARSIEMAIARFHHPIWTKLIATSLVTIGLAALAVSGPFVTLALIFYGAGIGLESIARGTLPLALFGAEHYPIVMGRIAMPSLVAQAAAPTIGAALLDTLGVGTSLAVVVAVCMVNVCLVVALLALARKMPSSES